MDKIIIRGARTHNLKNIDLDLPRNQLTVITGLSGSGKSSLAFDTLYAEGQRRYVESLSTYARQFLDLMEKPDVDLIQGLSPAIAIEQKIISRNPRSTVGTTTEIYDYLRLLFARIGEPHCPHHPDNRLQAYTISQIVDTLLGLPEGCKIALLVPIGKLSKHALEQDLQHWQAQGFVRVRLNDQMFELDSLPALSDAAIFTTEIVVDRIRIRKDIRSRLVDSLEVALHIAEGKIIALDLDSGEQWPFSTRFACTQCDYTLADLETNLFSFNSPKGACPKCDGLGETLSFSPDLIVAHPNLSLAAGAIRGWDRRNHFYFNLLKDLSDHYQFDIEQPFMDLPPDIQHIILYGSARENIIFHHQADLQKKIQEQHPFEGIIPNFERRFKNTDSIAVREELAKYQIHTICPLCQGSRLKQEALHVLIHQHNIDQLCQFTLKQAHDWFAQLKLSGQRAQIAEKIIHEIKQRLSFLLNVGLDYLSLSRSASTLSGGEAQRIRLTSHIGSGLTGVMYVLDEPSIGLHQRDNQRLLETLFYLRDLGNTLIVVEHDEDAIRHADYIVDMGPEAGEHGGKISAQGSVEDIINTPNSLTGDYLSGRRQISIPDKRRQFNAEKVFTLTGCRGNNLKDINLSIPSGLITCVTGVSGSGKSSLINDTLYPALAQYLYQSKLSPLPYKDMLNADLFDKIINVDQSPIGRTPRSNPATYTGLFSSIRELFANIPEARARGYSVGRFSFNVKGGRCEACQGAGVVKIEMHFLPDIYVACDVCHGQRYNRETLEIHYKGKDIAEILNFTVEQAIDFFKPVPAIANKLQLLQEVGLSYIRLGQSALTLSGGEAQRVKLALELSKKSTGNTLYILDEPTTGLHFHDIALLLEVLQKLCNQGNTILIIEHNLDVIQSADWIIDMGPEGGEGGGQILFEGQAEELCKHPKSYTAQFLKQFLSK